MDRIKPGSCRLASSPSCASCKSCPHSFPLQARSRRSASVLPWRGDVLVAKSKLRCGIARFYTKILQVVTGKFDTAPLHTRKPWFNGVQFHVANATCNWFRRFGVKQQPVDPGESRPRELAYPRKKSPALKSSFKQIVSKLCHKDLKGAENERT